MWRNKRQLGQSLVEVVVAAGIIGMAGVVLASAVTRAQANNRLAKERIIATRLAQEGWEWLQRQANNDWDKLYGKVDGVSTGEMFEYCLEDAWTANVDNIVNSGSCPGTDLAGASYARVLELDPETVSSEEKIVTTVTVSWESTRRTEHVSLEGTVAK